MIWLVALFLYVCDAARLLAPRQMLLVEAGRGQLAATALRENPLTFFGRILAFAPLLRPHHGVFVATWGRAWMDREGLEAVIGALERIRASLLVPRILAGGGFILLFGLGPLLTLLLGPNAAVAFTALLLYPTVAATIGWLWWRRRRFALTVSHSVWLSIEILICPAFLPNLVRKITGSHLLQADGAQILSAMASADVKDEVLARLASRAEELIEAASPDSIEEEQLRRYLGTLKHKP